jgi:hypothetical protein
MSTGPLQSGPGKNTAVLPRAGVVGESNKYHPTLTHIETIIFPLPQLITSPSDPFRAGAMAPLPAAVSWSDGLHVDLLGCGAANSCSSTSAPG